jgi:DNA-binding PadR family transcriptional regulator
MQKIITDLKITSGGILEFIVLKMLSSRSLSLREIRKELKRIGFQTPAGSLYPLLSSFRIKSFIISGYEESDDGGAIKTYCLHEKGLQRLTDLKKDWKRLNALIAEL